MFTFVSQITGHFLYVNKYVAYGAASLHNRPWLQAHSILINTLTHWGRDKTDAILQTTFSNAISWMKMFEFWLKFHWCLFIKPQLTIFQHWFGLWLGAEQATSHYLNQWWPSSTTHICVTRHRWVNWGRHNMAAIFRYIFLNENAWISIKISLIFFFFSKGAIDNIPSLVQIMAWRRPGDKPLSETIFGWFTDAYMHHWFSMS